jgi:Uma2 family endonuclease
MLTVSTYFSNLLKQKKLRLALDSVDQRYNTAMATTALVPLSEYLSTSYRPDCDYVEGVLEERNVGEISHSDAQSALNAYVRTQIRGFWSGVEVRIQVKADRFRIPDVAIVRGAKPSGRIITTPPEVAVEILSPEDRAASIQERIDDYLAFGIPCVWVINPETHRAWMHTNEGSREAKDGILRNVVGALAIVLAAVFAD